MSTQIAIRLDNLELAALDVEVTEGRAANRSDAVRRGIAACNVTSTTARRGSLLIELAHRGEAIYPDLDGALDLPHPRLD